MNTCHYIHTPYKKSTQGVITNLPHNFPKLISYYYITITYNIQTQSKKTPPNRDAMLI